MRRLQGGVATPVRVVSNRKLQKGAAIPVYVVTNRKHSGGIATPVYVVDSTHKIQGGEAIPVYEASDGEIESGAAIPVYVVEGTLGTSPIVAPWYLPNGIVLSDVVAAYAAKGAASYAASKINLANPGTYDCVDTGHAPDWDAVNGWKFDGIGQYLVIPNIFYTSNYTLIFRFTNFVVGSFNIMFGTAPNITDGETPVEFRIDAANAEGEDIGAAITQGLSQYLSPVPTAAIVAANKDGIYQDGVIHANINVIPYIESTHDMGIGANPTGAAFTQLYVQACAAYNKVLTQSQIQEIGANMP